MTNLEQLIEWRFEDAKELSKREEIYEANDKELKNGKAVKTDIALSVHAVMKADIESRKETYYKLEEEIERIEGLED